MNNPLLSIVVPTKNRYKTLKVLISTLSKWEETNFELIIQDNTENNSNFLKFINSFSSDKRIRYFHNSKDLSMTDNSTLAVEHAIGDFICFIGDDDGIIEGSLKVCRWMKKNKIDSISFKKASYKWPDLMNELSCSSKSIPNLVIPSQNISCEKVDVLRNLEKQLSKSSQSTLLGPSPYHGIVSKVVYEQLRKETNTFFPGPTPDMSSAIGMSFYINKHVYLNLPIVISGQALKSAGGMGSRGMHHGEIEKISWLPKNTSECWTPEIPYFWSGETITAESAIQALKKTNRISYISLFNFNRLIALCLVYNQGYRYRIFKHIINAKKSPLVNPIIIFLEWFKVQLERTIKFMNKKKSPTPVKSVFCLDIQEAIYIVNEHTRNNLELLDECYSKSMA